ncbi:hypothetical protein [Pseudarthrobacter sp. C1]|uniref:hypothetical protein n=1 Tax=Pseudarthrobacter sp. C1 TaxID=3108940 RepID=UPI002B053D19|nr:hypothetical protein [Pseudarthrobacter sp. C1]MEA3552008.1 hypothetical protein [Pseudarthrobacter sp. C1]
MTQTANGLRGHHPNGPGTFVDGEHLSAVWRTSSYLESIQWELDAAHESLREAVQQAASSGVDHGALLQAANMTSQELEAALLDAPPAWPTGF